MKVTVEQPVLDTSLKKVLSVVSTRTTLPVLSNVLLEAAEGKLTLTATDLEVCIRIAVNATVEREGATTLPARKFGQIVGALSGDEVVLDTDDNQYTSISCGRSFFRIVGLAEGEFPRDEPLDETWTLCLPAQEVRGILTKVSYATSPDDTRQVLNGILLSMRNGVLTTAATDGRRLALVEKPLVEDSVPDGDTILPPKIVSELAKLVEGEGEMSIKLTESRAVFRQGETLMISKLVEGTYPNYRQVIPSGFAHSAVIPRETFSAVLNRVSMVVSDTSAAVNLELGPAALTVSATSSEFGEGTEPLEVSYDGEPLKIAFNPVFLADPLRHLECDQVVFQFNDEYSPICISGDEGFLYVLMPMRG